MIKTGNSSLTKYFQLHTSSSKSPIEEENKQQMTQEIREFPLLEEFREQLYTWRKPLSSFVDSVKFQKIYDFVKFQYANKTCYPPPELIFKAFQVTPVTSVKVVIIGQDPYFNEGEATGLSFSVSKRCKMPPSVKNIYRCIRDDPNIKGFIVPTHGDLTYWAEQGVLMLNGSLTVEARRPMSHSECGWSNFTDEVVSYIDKEFSGIVFMCWGKYAQDKVSRINPNRNFMLKTSHPSGFSASQGFLESRHFSKCNELLVQGGKSPIDWNLKVSEDCPLIKSQTRLNMTKN